jgi:hypothetical protein
MGLAVPYTDVASLSTFTLLLAEEVSQDGS